MKINPVDVTTTPDDLEDLGIAYLSLKNAVQRAENRLSKLYAHTDDFDTRADVLQTLLILREALA